MIGLLGLDRNSLVVEVASNDGYLLQYFKQAGIPVLGIEPAGNVAAAAIAKGIPTEVFFFNDRTAAALRQRGIAADLIVANNVLAHVPDINAFAGGFARLLKPDGVLTVEFPHLLNLIGQVQFDTIYHEHMFYLSLSVVGRVFARHGLRIFDVEEVPTHGGSLRVFACRADCSQRSPAGRVADLCRREVRHGLEEVSTYRRFQDQLREVKNGLLEFLIDTVRAGKSVAGYGAPAKGNTLLNYCGIGPEYVNYTVDLSPHKQGLYLPGTRIPILAPDRISETRPDYLLILPWNIKEEIAGQMAHVRSWGGRFVTAIPKIQVF
jgi:SAM-dependent methyltransferase